MPTLSLSYEPGTLRVDSNETGFTYEDVEAISSIRKSKKSGLRHSEGYIGEKGIGFKSVFRVAEAIWISSNQYSFNFDKKRKLGMIAPEWAKFPAPLKVSHTSFYFRLDPDYKSSELYHALRHFDSKLLLFLRRLRRIWLRVEQPDGSTWTGELRRHDQRQGSQQITSIQVAQRAFRYLRIEYIVEKLPQEHRRPQVEQSTLVLAFDVTDIEAVPRRTSQNVYSFLPIGKYGLKVMIMPSWFNWC